MIAIMDTIIRPGFPVFLLLISLAMAGSLPQRASAQSTLTETPIVTPDAGQPPPDLEMRPGRNPMEMVKVFIHFQAAPGENEKALVRAGGGTIRRAFWLIPALSAEIPLAAVENLQKLPFVTRIEPVVQAYAVDAELDNTWGVKRIQAALCHAGGNKGDEVKVAVIDTGVDYTHPDLNHNYAGGYDFVNDDTDPRDDHGHGTHVAGTIAAEDDTFGVVGVAPKARIYALKVLGASGSGGFDDVIAALQWCIDNGIQVTNNSYGSSVDPGTAVRTAFANAAAAGIIHVAAAGNSGPGTNTVIFPGQYDSTIAVAAVDSANNRASFSSTGPAVEVAAPGVNIYSTNNGGGYTWKSGTSMATPHVAGVVALMIRHGLSGLTQIRQVLQSTADDLGPAGRDDQYGYGLVDPDEAAPPRANLAAPVVDITRPGTGAKFFAGEGVPFTGSALDPEEGDLSANLAWSSSIDGGPYVPGSASWIAFLNKGNHTITAQVNDAGDKPGSDTIMLIVKDPPVARDDAAAVNEDTVLDINVLANDTTDAAGGALGVISLTQPAHGAAAIVSNRARYTPNANFNGPDGFTYTIRDSQGRTDTAGVSITVNPVNDFPVANGDSASTGFNVPVTIPVLANDTDADGDPLTVLSVTPGAHGSTAINADQTITYTPNVNFSGSDSFSYTVSDGHGGTGTAPVLVTVRAPAPTPTPTPVPPVTVYEDAEDGSTARWTVYDNTPPGAVIRNIFDAPANSRVIQFSGAGTDNGYRLRSSSLGPWNNRAQFVVEWSSKFSEYFVVYIDVQTAAGHRYMQYIPANRNDLGMGEYVFHGLGGTARDGQWHTFTRDLQADLQEAQPGNTITEVNGFLIRGNGMVDNIRLRASLPPSPTPTPTPTRTPTPTPKPLVTVYENAEDGSTARWAIYDNDPTGAVIRNIFDASVNSRVIHFSGAETNNGYRLLGPGSGPWKNQSQLVAEWRLKYSEYFVVYFDVQTTAGHRYLQYIPVNTNDLGTGEYVLHGLGTTARDGQWHSFTRDLQADLQEAQPGNAITEVNGFLIRGNGMVDNIHLRDALP
ncbi:MAG: S8 family serine peptidase [Candidatus Omnitrophica bacterium]|nr:S8 family serine peptidase [Candidatus Omnitrophota bacterium]